jgi:F-type H+-transporting ATPase subunit b
MAGMEYQVAEVAEPLIPGEEVGTGTLVETDEEREAFPPFDPTTYASQLLWFAITFVALYFVLAKVAIPRIIGILEARRGKIEGDLLQAERLKEKSEAALASYEKALADARANAFTIAEGSRNEAKAASEAKRKAIEADLAKKLTAAESSIAAIKSRALADVGTIATETTAAVVKALVEADVAAKEVTEAVSAAMNER